MKLGREMKICPFKFENKASTEELTRLIYSANDILYKYSRRYISNELKTNILCGLKDVGIKAKELTCTAASKPKQEEFLNKLRDTYSAITKTNCEYVQEDLCSVQNTINYMVYNYVQNRKNNSITDDYRIETIKDIKEVYSTVIKPYISKYGDKGLKLDKIRELQEELLGAFRI